MTTMVYTMNAKIDAALKELWDRTEEPDDLWYYSPRGLQIFQRAIYGRGRPRGGRWRGVRRWRRQWARSHGGFEPL